MRLDERAKFLPLHCGSSMGIMIFSLLSSQKYGEKGEHSSAHLSSSTWVSAAPSLTRHWPTPVCFSKESSLLVRRRVERSRDFMGYTIVAASCIRY